ARAGARAAAGGGGARLPGREPDHRVRLAEGGRSRPPSASAHGAHQGAWKGICITTVTGTRPWGPRTGRKRTTSFAIARALSSSAGLPLDSRTAAHSTAPTSLTN